MTTRTTVMHCRGHHGEMAPALAGRWGWMAGLAAVTALVAGCKAPPVEGTCTVGPDPGVRASANLWQRAHPGGRMVICMVGSCGHPSRALGQKVRSAGPQRFVARGF